MNGKIRAAMAFLAMLVLFCAAVAVGAWRGFSGDREQVAQALSSFSSVLRSRVEMGHNLLVVALRHLSGEDPLVKAVQADLAELSGNSPLLQKAKVNDRFALDAAALLEALEKDASLLADARDLGYVTGLLPRGLEQSAKWADAGQYNKAAQEFNRRLTGQLNGRLAMLLGVREAELFDAGGDRI